MYSINPCYSLSAEYALVTAQISPAAKVRSTILPRSPLLIRRKLLVGLATSFLQGSKEEWSLVRRHPSESTFGVQLAGSKPGTLAAAAEIMAKEFTGNVDFVDVNCGCPIDLVFRSGSGSARESPWTLSHLQALRYPLCFHSAGYSWEIGENTPWDEQGFGRDSFDCEAANGDQGWSQHCSQTHAPFGFRMGCRRANGTEGWFFYSSTLLINFVWGGITASWSFAAAALHKKRGLGLHQGMRGCCPCSDR